MAVEFTLSPTAMRLIEDSGLQSSTSRSERDIYAAVRAARKFHSRYVVTMDKELAVDLADWYESLADLLGGPGIERDNATYREIRAAREAVKEIRAKAGATHG